jgi:hypothetical protein
MVCTRDTVMLTLQNDLLQHIESSISYTGMLNLSRRTEMSRHEVSSFPAWYRKRFVTGSYKLLCCSDDRCMLDNNNRNASASWKYIIPSSLYWPFSFIPSPKYWIDHTERNSSSQLRHIALPTFPHSFTKERLREQNLCSSDSLDDS